MKFFYLNIALISIFWLGVFNLQAQTKFEKEVRIEEDEAPKIAVNYIKNLDFIKTVKWYQESGIGIITYEAKTKYNDQFYSVEFNDSGELLDVEIEIRLDEVETETYSRIKDHFNQYFDKYKISRLQRQLSGNEEDIKRLINSDLTEQERKDLITVKYEIIAQVKKDKDKEEYEFLFSDKGELEARKLVVKENDDFLIY